MSPVVYNLSLQRWSFFVTLTFKSTDDAGNPVKVPDTHTRQRMLFAFLRAVAKGAKRERSNGKRMSCVPFEALLWAAREETGELNGRHHFHILLDGLPHDRQNRTECFVMKSLWNDCGGGFADCRTFDTRLPGVQYVLKGLEGWSLRNANSYEMRKFDEDHEDRTLIVANACVKKWARRTEQRASGGTQSQCCAVSLVGGRKAAPKRTKETLEELEARIRGNWLNMHPAGVSFVR